MISPPVTPPTRRWILASAGAVAAAPKGICAAPARPATVTLGPPRPSSFDRLREQARRVGPWPPGGHEVAPAIVLDFAGGALGGRPAEAEPVVAASLGTVFEPACYPLAVGDRWRLMFDVAVPNGETADIRAFVRRGGEALTETWIGQAFGASRASGPTE